tara:strand:+ start:4804 stop:6150 length:1347 start_codon:yes stop_codon:yes gene_type:complete
MKYKSDLFAVHLNEFNLNFLLAGAKKFKCKSILELFKSKKISTFTKDLEQNFNLDPWVQSVSINTGKSSKQHKILNLGQKIPRNTNQIWDVLSKKKIRCSIWGSMNSILKRNRFIDLYFPDPWNFNDKPFPKNLKNFFYLPNYYAKNYLDFNFFKVFLFSLIFLIESLFNKCFYFLLSKTTFILKTIFKCGFKNFILFFFFDLISLNILRYKLKNNKSQFTIIFLNSLAHFQHNNWDEKKNEKFYFLFTELICKEILNIQKYYKSTILFNGFTQKKISPEYLLRPTNPEKFIRYLGIKYKKIEQDMTNGAIIFFKNKKDRKEAQTKLSNFYIFNYNVFEIKKKSNTSLFYKIKIKTFKKISLNEINNSKSSYKYISYFNNKILTNKINRKKLDYNFIRFFFKNINFIKTTGVHQNKGVLFYKNVFIQNKIKKIENHKIFDLIVNHFNI